MKSLLRLCGVAALAAACAARSLAASETTAADPVAAELAAIVALREKRPEGLEQLTPAERFRILSQRGEELEARAQAFFAAHPNRPERWAALNASYQFGRRFAKPRDPAAPADAKVETDETAQRAWNAAMEKRIDEMLAAPDAPPEVCEAALYTRIMRHIPTRAEEAATVLPIARTAVAQLEQRFPQSRYLTPANQFVLGALAESDPATYRAEVTRLVASANAGVAQFAQGLKAVEDLRATPMELAFTALDGSKVDLAALRGKVVLIDFWATWCKPCVAELPHVKKAYDEYHARGFEVIGISLDQPRDEKKLRDFVAKEGLPWPQYFDGKAWKGDLPERYGIHAIPAMFLLDQSGKLVDTNARGERLEAQLKRLLAGG